MAENTQNDFQESPYRDTECIKYYSCVHRWAIICTLLLIAGASAFFVFALRPNDGGWEHVVLLLILCVTFISIAALVSRIIIKMNESADKYHKGQQELNNTLYKDFQLKQINKKHVDTEDKIKKNDIS